MASTGRSVQVQPNSVACDKSSRETASDMSALEGTRRKSGYQLYLAAVAQNAERRPLTAGSFP